MSRVKKDLSIIEVVWQDITSINIVIHIHLLMMSEMKEEWNLWNERCFWFFFDIRFLPCGWFPLTVCICFEVDRGYCWEGHFTIQQGYFQVQETRDDFFFSYSCENVKYQFPIREREMDEVRWTINVNQIEF